MNTRRAIARLFFRVTTCAALVAGAAAFARAQQPPPGEPAIPEPVGFVNDVANVMDETSRAKLEGFLDQVQQKTGAQFAVLTVPTTAPLVPDEYKVKVFEKWGIGGKEKDEGLLLLVAIQEREAKFETGYGLEGTLPDGWQSRMFRQEMAPRFQQGDFAGGITAGMVASAARVAKEKGVTLEWDGKELRYDERRSRTGLPPIVFLGILIFVIVLFVIASQSGGLGGGRPGRRRRYGSGGFGDWGGGGWGGGLGGFGGGGFGGGGFGGGGGGGSFGGFGGGSSGGGGGGGKW
jgi:uncharacterized protein